MYRYLRAFLRQCFIFSFYLLFVNAWSPSWRPPRSVPQRTRVVLGLAPQERVIFYSPNFHRHVVADFDGRNYSTVVESFLFLDEAEEKYQEAKLAATVFSSSTDEIAGIGLETEENYRSRCEEHSKGKYPASLASATGGPQVEALWRVVERFNSMLSSPFFSYFPQNEMDLICERIQFLLAPLPRKIQENLDIPKLFADGFGAGLTESQVSATIASLRQILTANSSRALEVKAPAAYMVATFGIPIDGLTEPRNKLDTILDSESSADVAAFAYLRTLGITWEQCRIILEAFSSTMVCCEPERTYEIFEGKARDTFIQSSIRYLRMRFQIYPADVINMIRAHPRLSTYSTNVLISHADTLQSILQMTSRELKELVQAKPSVLGASAAKVNNQVSCLKSRLGLSNSNLRRLLRHLPSVLEYSWEDNLEPKINYLEEVVGLRGKNLTNVVLSRPYILAISLPKSLKPCVEGLMDVCGLDSGDLSNVVVRTPRLLTAKWKTNLKPKLAYLVDRLNLGEDLLREIVISSPNILMQSIVTSLEPKIQMLEEAAGNEAELVPFVIQTNPALLDYSRASLKRRIAMLEYRNVTFLAAFSPRNDHVGMDSPKERNILKRRKRPVFEIRNGEQLASYSDVEAAANAIGVTRANMYNIIKVGREYDGKTYSYGALPEFVHHFEVKDIQKLTSFETDLKNAAQSADGENDTMNLIELMKRPKWSPAAVKSKTVHIVAFVSARVYPPGGRSKGMKYTSGAMAMYFPQLRGTRMGEILLRQAIERTISSQALPEEAGTDFLNGIVMSFFPDSKPSRNRCGLYACSNVLRVIVELIASEPSFRDHDVNIEMITDSEFVCDLLGNHTSVMNWGTFKNRKEFIYDGPEPIWRIHPDILYPTARTYYRIKTQTFATPKFGNRLSPLANNVNIRFLHQSEVPWTRTDDIIQRSGALGKSAAAWQYQTQFQTV